MKKIVLPVAVLLFSTLFPNTDFATSMKKGDVIPSKQVDFVQDEGFAFLPFEMFETIDCDMNKSMALIELIKVAETEKQLYIAQEEAVAKLLQAPKEEVKETIRPVQTMGMTEIMFIIEEVGRGSMY